MLDDRDLRAGNRAANDELVREYEVPGARRDSESAPAVPETLSRRQFGELVGPRRPNDPAARHKLERATPRTSFRVGETFQGPAGQLNALRAENWRIFGHAAAPRSIRSRTIV